MTKEITYPEIAGKYKEIKHSSGLTLLLYPMPEFNTSYALFGTKFGSIDNEFTSKETGDYLRVPDGIAHYLEHKMFENEEGDAFASYAKTGASANAYTSFDRTAYLFSTTANFGQSLEILLDFVSRPYFTKQTVDKEREIIGQEIQMYVDDPDWQVFFNMLKALYVNHPINIDIAGTIESIAEIDAQCLYKCYNAFYNLNNMVLSVAGNFTEEEVLACCDKVLKPAPQFTTQLKPVDEPEHVAEKEIICKLPVAKSLFSVGYKLKPLDEKETFLKQVAFEIVAEMIAGDYTALYRTLYDDGLINATFSGEVLAGRGYLALAFAGESSDPHVVYGKISEEICRLQKEGVPQSMFETALKYIYGRYMNIYSRVSSVASVMLSSHFAGVQAFDIVKKLKSITKQEIETLIREISIENSAISIVKSPK